MAEPEFTWQQTDDRFAIDGPGGRVYFVRTGDRWTHDLAFPSGPEAAGASPLVSTVEAEPGRDDPARIVSPVYQELQRHEFFGDNIRGLCVLLTGHMHQHHFSASVSLYRLYVEDEQGSFVVLEFDVADRCRSPVSALAATYLVRLGSSHLLDAGPNVITWTGFAGESGPAKLELRCDPPGSLALAEAGRNATRVQVLAAVDPAVFTHRLRYRWRWSCTSR